MQTDPASEWRRLADEYHARSDEELRELAADFSDLTDTAQQALCQEMRSRGLGDPAAATAVRQQANLKQLSTNAPWSAASSADTLAQAVYAMQDSVPGLIGRVPNLVSDNVDQGKDNAEGTNEYTWKTELCELDTPEDAMQLQEVLKRAGIESWFNFGGYTSSSVPSISHSLLIGGIKVLVAADQLDHAREIAVKPIPQEIIDESKEEIPEFVEPKCPKCGSDDVVLEAVDTQNHWRCEACDNAWTDDAEPESASPTNPAPEKAS